MKTKHLSLLAIPAFAIAGALGASAQDPTTTKVPETPAETMTDPAPTPPTNPRTEATRTTTGKFSASQTADEWRSSKIVGLYVYNSKKEKIGDINELILDGSGKVVNAVVGVGGFLGMGEKNVAIPFADLKFSRKSDGTPHVTLESTKEALEAAPNFTYYTPAKG